MVSPGWSRPVLEEHGPDGKIGDQRARRRTVPGRSRGRRRGQLSRKRRNSGRPSRKAGDPARWASAEFPMRGSGLPDGASSRAATSADSNAWYKVAPQVAEHHRACTYDRAGRRLQRPGSPAPRWRGDRQGPRPGPARRVDPRSVRAGGALLGWSLRAGLRGPRRPQDVVGMVLVDPSVTYQNRRFAERFGPGAAGIQPLVDAAARCLAAARARALPSPDPALKVLHARAGRRSRRQRRAARPGSGAGQLARPDLRDRDPVDDDLRRRSPRAGRLWRDAPDRPDGR